MPVNVTTWLRELGLEQYAPAFVENEVDELSLPSLTAEDLRGLGVTAIGHRRRLLDAIAALCAKTSGANVTIIPPSTLQQPDWLVSICRQFGGVFDLEDLGLQDIEGFGEPRHAWRILGESGVASRFEADELAGRNPFRICRPPKGRGQSR